MTTFRRGKWTEVPFDQGGLCPGHERYTSPALNGAHGEVMPWGGDHDTAWMFGWDWAILLPNSDGTEAVLAEGHTNSSTSAREAVEQWEVSK